jgi:2-polyprenyl-6-methoxyphenol hydroxylase-like FAD-dependent oxidoreductase
MASIQVGIGMVLWPNGMRVLRRLGVEDEVRASANPLSALEFYSASGERLMRYPVEPLNTALGAPTVAFVRRRLHVLLTNAFGEDAIRLGARCEGLTQDADGVTVSLADGEQLRGDVLIAADGVHSGLRERILGLKGLPDFPPYRYTVWHSIIPFPDRELIRPGIFYLVFCRGMRFNVFRVAEDSDDTYWAALDYVPASFQEPGSSLDYLRERFGQVAAPVPDLLAASEGATIDRMRIHGEAPVPHWGDGRFTLLGDAAHPLTTVLGQGAGQALEDGVVLADSLTAAPDLVGGLRAYEAKRQERTGKVIQLIGTLSSAATEETALRTWIRDQILIKRLFRRTVGRRFEATLKAASAQLSSEADHAA